MNIKGLLQLISYLAILVIGGFVFLLTWYYQPAGSKTQGPAVVADTIPPGPRFDDPALLARFDLGKEMFRNNCAACHNRNMKDNLTGPALGNISQNWADYPPEDLYNWIRNSQAMINAGHPRATALWEQFKPVVMNSFLTMTDDQFDAILFYIDETAKN